jgi:thioredoxin 1
MELGGEWMINGGNAIRFHVSRVRGGDVNPIRVMLIILASLCMQAPALAQSAGKPDSVKPIVASAASSGFAPLDRWTAAVLVGDKQALTALYTINPPAQAQTPQGKSQDPAEEPVYWAGLAGNGLKKLESKILEIRKPQPGVAVLILRFELNQEGKSAGEQGVVSAVQVWVQQQDGWRIYATQRGDVVSIPASRLPEPEKPNTDLYAPPEEAQKEVSAALLAAEKENKRVILVFGANWCFDCHVLDEAFHSKAIAPIVEANYRVVHVNIGEMNQNLDLVKKYDSTLGKGVPTLAVLDPDGKVVFSQKQGEFESSARLGPEDVVQFLEKWKPAKSQ